MYKEIDYYKTLQVHHDAGIEIIDAAYRCLSKKYHPDINRSPDAAEYMKFINVAYGILGDARKRKEYHAEWLKNNYKDNNVKKDIKKYQVELAYKIDHASKALNEFFSNTVNEEWVNAYQRLTFVDKANVTLEEFLEWKKIISHLYKLGDYKITYFKKYCNCDYAGVIYSEIMQFSVSLREMQLFTGQISEEHTQKYVAFDQDGWRVCLGYTDLKPTIRKFENIAHSIPKADKNDIFIKTILRIDPLTGILSYIGFKEQAEREMLRSQRYGNPLSLAVITLSPCSGNENTFKDNELEPCISYVSEILCRYIRKTDIISRYNDSSFAILFTETKLEEAKEALDKLVMKAYSNDYFNYKLYSACICLVRCDIDKIMKSTLEKAVFNEVATEINSDIDNNDNDIIYDAKLGKYKFSDILHFNYKSKNYF